MFHSLHVKPDNVHDKFAEAQIPRRSFPRGTLSLGNKWGWIVVVGLCNHAVLPFVSDQMNIYHG